MKNKLLWPQRLPPVSPCGHLCHRKTPRVRKLSNTCSGRAPGNAFGANRTSNATDNREEEVAGMRAESILEEADEQPSAPTPAPAAENQAEPAPEPPALPEPEIEAIGDNSADMVYVPGFGWIESQGPNQATCAEDMYENGNKIGIMG